MRMLVVLLFLGLALAGCAESGGDYSFGGVFSTGRTSEDLADFQRTVEPYTGAPVAIMESWPEQFLIQNLSQSDCAELREKLVAKDYLQSVRDCKSSV